METVIVTLARPLKYGRRVHRAGDRIEVAADYAKLLAKRGAIQTTSPVKAAPLKAAPQTKPTPAASTPTPPPDDIVSDDAAGSATAAPDPSFEDLGIAGKTAELLRAGGLHTLADVEQCEDLTAIKGIGEATAATILAAIESHRQG